VSPVAPPNPTVTEEAVQDALRGVIDPELKDNVVDLGMVRGIQVSPGGRVRLEVALTVASCPLRSQLEQDVRARVALVPGVSAIEVRTGEMTKGERSALMSRARWRAREQAVTTDIPDSARVVAVASGKGGVGKSSITVNVAAALARTGLTVGLLDADIWGFSVPRMLGLEGRLRAEGTPESWEMIPLPEQAGKGLLKVVSMGFLADQEDEAIMWRGLQLNRALQHFVENVRWGELDYLLIDMPPGTGDVQMGLARMLPRAEMVIVTTPALAAQKVATRAADMARKGFLRVAGVIENMSTFTCEHGTSYELFGSGGGQRLAETIGVPLIGSVPFDPRMAAAGDAGDPVAAGGTGAAAEAFGSIADRLVSEIVPLVEMDGCTARMLESLDAAAAKL
jgi:ATP-binding protein involved in chromosome partitioning